MPEWLLKHRLLAGFEIERMVRHFNLTGVTGFNPKVPKTLLRELVDPAPLGLSGFALTTLVLSLQARDVTNPQIAIGLGIYPFTV
jgi:succinate-acetate transporter protein